MTRRHPLTWLTLVGVLLALLAACQPADPPVPIGEQAEASVTGRATPEPGNPAKEQVDSAEVNAELTTVLDVQPDTLAETENGIPVGFTTSGNPFKGNPDAPVLIQEFSDYQCPFCQRFYSQTMGALIDNQIAAGEATIVFYDFPLTNIHPQAVAAARAARCAGEQGANAYWAMHDALFDNLGQWGLSDPSAQFSQYAAGIDLDTDAFDTCLASDRHTDAVNADVALGRQNGVTGTPAFLINGQLVAGAQPLSVFDQAIAQAMEGQPVAAAQPAEPPSAAPTIDMPTPVTFSDQYAFAIGDADAPVTIVEFTDYQCPFCSRHSQQTLPTILSNLVETGRARYVLKDLPLDSLHPQARQAAAAARCAGEQDAYLAMHDALFDNQTEWSGQADVAERFSRYAEELELDLDAFAACLSSGRYDAAIEENVQEAFAQGISGTPTFFIDGYNLFRGAQSYDVFEQIVVYAENGELEQRIQEAVDRQNAAAQAAQQSPTPVPDADVPTADAFSIGDPDAPVTIVEYTDYQCPFCSRHFQQTLPQIIANYVDTGIVRYVFKDFPLTSIHPQAVEAAVAARCAGDQGAFYDMHSRLFEEQDAWSGNGNATDLFLGYAEALALDGDVFADCLAAGTYEDAVMADFEEGAGFGVRGTPAFFVNGAFVNGAQPYSVFEQAIAAAQAEAE